MAGPERLMGACGETSHLLMRLIALLTHKTLKEEDIPMLLPITAQLNNMMAALTGAEGDSSPEEEITEFMELISERSHGLVAMGVLSISAMMLEKLSKKENWCMVRRGRDKESFEEKTSQMVDALLASINTKVKGEEDGKEREE